MKTIPPDDAAFSGVTSSTDEEKQAASDRLSRHALDHGLYDRNEMPDRGDDE